MYIVTEADAKTLLSIHDAIEAVETCFAALDRGEARVFPVVHGRTEDVPGRFGLKSGVSRRAAPAGERGIELVGVKVGTYWPGNSASGLANHGSTTLLLDARTGQPRALIAASHLNGLRTAAANGVATRYLSRPDATQVGVVGAGHQAWFEIQAVAAVRRIERIRVWSRNQGAADRFATRLRMEGLEASAESLEEVVRGAEILVTVTASTEPLVKDEWVGPGTHISAMGADAVGKQELDLQILRRASVFADLPEQATRIGELQHAHAAGWLKDIHPIGAVISGRVPGRVGTEQVTVFDSSGLAVQDLAIAETALTRALERGCALHVPLNGIEGGE